jgi:hypothetical protein
LGAKLTLREEHKLRVFENRILGRIFGSKRDDMTEGWRKLHNEELHNLCSLPSIISLAQDKGQWRSLVNAVMNLPVQ